MCARGDRRTVVPVGKWGWGVRPTRWAAGTPHPPPFLALMRSEHMLAPTRFDLRCLPMPEGKLREPAEPSISSSVPRRRSPGYCSGPFRARQSLPASDLWRCPGGRRRNSEARNRTMGAATSIPKLNLRGLRARLAARSTAGRRGEPAAVRNVAGWSRVRQQGLLGATARHPKKNDQRGRPPSRTVTLSSPICTTISLMRSSEGARSPAAL